MPVQLDPLHCEHFEESAFGALVLLLRLNTAELQLLLCSPTM